MNVPPHLQLALADEVCRRSLVAFHRRSFEIAHGGQQLMMAPYIDAMCHQLERVMRGEIKRLIITVPPRHGKSELASMAFPAWCLGHDPSLKFMIVSYGLELAAAQVSGARQLLDDPAYQRLFPRTKVKRGRDKNHAFATEPAGNAARFPLAVL